MKEKKKENELEEWLRKFQKSKKRSKETTPPVPVPDAKKKTKVEMDTVVESNSINNINNINTPVSLMDANLK